MWMPKPHTQAIEVVNNEHGIEINLLRHALTPAESQPSPGFS